MRKRIFPALILFIIVIAVIPWIDGLIFKKQYYNLITSINKDNRLKIEVLEYDEGWLSSSAKIRISLVNNGLIAPIQKKFPQINLAPEIGFVIEEKISHGPIVYTGSLGSIKLGYAGIISIVRTPEELEASLPWSIKSKGEMQISTFANFNDTWTGAIHLPLLSLYAKDIGAVTWNKSDGEFYLYTKNKNIKHITAQLQIGGIIFESSDQNTIIKEILVRPMTYKYDAEHEKNGLWTGSTNMLISGLSVTQQDGSMFAADEFDVNSEFGVNGSTLYHTNITLNIHSLKLPSVTLPFVSYLHLQLTAINFSSEGLVNYINFFKSRTAAAIKSVELGTMEGLLAHTIIPTSELEGNIIANTVLGSFQGYVKSVWKKDTPLPNTINDIISNSMTTINLKGSSFFVNHVIQIYGVVVKASAFKKFVSKLSDEGKINPSDNAQIMDILKKHKPGSIFDMYVDHLSLSADESSELKLLYPFQASENASKPVPPSTTVKTPSPPHKQTPEQFLDTLTTLGYLNKEKEDYVTTITLDNGVWRMNGWIINPQH